MKKIYKRIVSFLTATVMMSNFIPFDELPVSLRFPKFPSLSTASPIKATATMTASEFALGKITFNKTSDFVDYCSYYADDNCKVNVQGSEKSFAEAHQNDTLFLTFSDDGETVRGIIQENFAGLGNDDFPFKGEIHLPDNSEGHFKLSTHSPLFSYVYDSVKILSGSLSTDTNNTSYYPEVTVQFERLSDTASDVSTPLLAQRVIHNSSEGAVSANWSVELVSSSTHTYSGVIGNIGEGARVNLAFKNDSSANVVSNAPVSDTYCVADAGVICGAMQNGSVLSLSYTESSSAHTITSANGNAGGLIGTMNGNAEININNMPSVSLNAESLSAYAGGLVGELTSQATISGQAISVSGSISGANGAGGLFGHYTNYATEFDIANYNNTATVYGQYCGGLFGVLENNKSDSETSLALTIKNTNNTGTFSVKSGTGDTYSSDGCFGGMIGRYITNDLKNSLILDNLSFDAEAKTSFLAFGGAIGIVDSKAYVQTLNNTQASAKGTNKASYFGGLIGATSENNGVFVNLGNFALNTNSEQFRGGGVAGLFKNGVLRLTGTTDMTNAKPKSESNCGQLVGNNDNVLVYAPLNNWTFKRSIGALADDIGTWGEVVRGIDDSNSASTVYFDSTGHTVTIAGAKTSMGTADDFVRTALNIQLNQGTDYDCLLFADKENKRSVLLDADASLSISADISLAGTGITGFMRDGGDVNSIGSFNGTFDGNSHTITLAVGETYGTGAEGQTEGMGQIYRHQHNGLFSVLAGTVSNLTVNGNINVSNCVDGMNIGGIASRNNGNVKLTGVTAGETVNYNESSSVAVKGEGKNIGGYIGFAGKDGSIDIDGISSVGATFNLSGNHKDWNVYGGAIGKVTASNFTINIGKVDDDNNKLTNSLTVSTTGITGVGTNSDSGGLIGYITAVGSYGNRTVNINNLEFSNCTVGNASSSTGGGFLGYSWLNTTSNINGLTVTGTSAINNVAGNNVSVTPNIGVMLYSSTGKMTVNSLAVTGMSIANGGGTSLGMIVNCAYNSTSGLYLDVLNSGYTLTGVSLPSSIGVYDELSAYSASDVIAGGGGIVSINMNSDRSGTEAKTSVTGTYQNKISRVSDTGIDAVDATKYANSNTRYYYNLDVMNSTDGGQNLVLWSVSKYVASNIQGEFKNRTSFSIEKNLAGTANLTGLSFYPLKNADNCSIGNLTLTFDYDGICTGSESVSNTDSYTRDPALLNQHFLMHSGLFINLPVDKTIEVTGKLSLAGTFLELSGTADSVTNATNGYSGVIVSKTMNGNFKCETGSIELAGITPKTTGSTEYTSGYLLINSVTRESDTSNAPQVIISNLYTSSGYSGTSPVTGSLIGNASGNDLTIKFSHVKLDARTADLSDSSANTDLNTAYGTLRSIFKDAVFLNSIKTNKTAVLEYYYTYAEDWEDGDDEDSSADRFVTYGKEVKDTDEYKEERTVNNTATYVSLENMYSGAKRLYTNPESSASLSSEYNFSSGWLRYVGQPYTSSSDTEMYFRELKVNVEKNGPLTGCGTYNHPYVVSGSDLTAVANFISSGSTSDMQKIRLPKTEVSGITANAKGNRWCNDLSDCAVFEVSGDKYVYNYLDKTESTSSRKTVEGDTDSESYSVDTSKKEVTYTKTTVTESDGIKTTNIRTVVYKYDKETTGEAVAVDGGVSENEESWKISESSGTITKVVLNAESNTSTSTTYTITKHTNEWGKENVRLYLANAYYKIESNIELGSNYVGLGCSTNSANGNYAFRGVIVGEQTSESDKSPKWTITNNSPEPLVKVSNGSVVKDINVTVSAENIELTQTAYTYDKAYFGYYSQCQYYGGIIGEIMGGDNIIDNSYVSYSYKDSTNADKTTSITLKGSYGTIIPVGGYVGVVVFGGLIFKNMTAVESVTVPAEENETANTVLKVNNCGLTVNYKDSNNNLKNDNLADNSKQSAWAGIYVNPIVGRVINGYAVNETSQFSVTEDNHYHDDSKTPRTGTAHTLKNGTKHYSIADIKKGETDKLSFGVTADNGAVTNIVPTNATTDGTINIPNSQAFFILSLITQSCAGTAQTADGNYFTSLSYGTNTTIYGMSHIAEYSDVGKEGINKDTNTDYGYASSDTAENTAVPYIIRWYTSADANGKFPARCVTSTKGYYDINLTGTAKNEKGETVPATYTLPDSFRGLGSVGNYDTATSNTSPFSIKLDVFDGKGCSIDEDIYLNKYYIDNYLNGLHKGTNQSVGDNTEAFNGNHNTNNHGIGLFDSVITKGQSSQFTDFILTGSVKTEIYNNTYKENLKDQIITTTNNGNMLWLSVGGVVGWSTNGMWLGFDNIELKDFSISGSSFLGGLLGYSGIKDNTKQVTISECSADNISVKMTGSSQNSSTTQARNGIGCFVGKVQEGRVVIYGTDKADNNDNTNIFSTVSIKSFGFALENTEYFATAGGLVGFAGNGCKTYDMKVKASNGCTVTIGGDKIRFAGGIVGTMQPYQNTGTALTSCIAIFKNCTVENINLKGNFAGGFYGGKWINNYAPYRIELDNCKMVGNTNSNNTIIGVGLSDNGADGASYVGGFIALGNVYSDGNPNILIKDCKVSNYNLSSTAGNKGYVGGFVGYCNSFKDNSSITCYIHDSSVENCKIGGSNNYAGGAVGRVMQGKANRILGYNIKLATITTDTSNMGAWIGHMDRNDTATSIQFSGMAIYGSGFNQNIGNGVILNNTSFVFADYTGKSNYITSDSTPDTADYNSTDNVPMPKYPYININPQSKVGTEKIISGDGAVLYGSTVTGYDGKTGDKTMASKIYSELNDIGNTRRYTTFSAFNAKEDAKISGDKKIDYYLSRTAGTDGDRISTYYTEIGKTLEGTDDFAVVVISNTDNSETTNLINRYIQLVTNTSTDYTDYSDYYTIDVKTCQYSGSGFSITDGTSGLKWTAPVIKTENGVITQTSKGSFGLNNDKNADSVKKNTFTLVDVQFKDPFNTNKIAYHLYVPVYTIKQMTFSFSASALTDTHSVSYPSTDGISGYEEAMESSSLHVDSLKTWVTQYIRFTYNADDLNVLLSGGNLKWNHDKYVTFNTQQASSKLPDDTYMVLVDPNGGADKVYYASAGDFYSVSTGLGGWKIELTKFNKNKGNTDTAFSVSTFNDMIAKAIEEKTPSDGTGKGMYSEQTFEEGHEVQESEYNVYRIDSSGVKHYYKYAGGKGSVDLAVPSTYELNEDYYISMYVPKVSNYNSELYYYTINSPDILNGTRSAVCTADKPYNVLIADLYKQETSYELSKQEQITDTNNHIDVKATTTIQITNTNAPQYLTNEDLYHAFDIMLNCYGEDGSVVNEIAGYDNMKSEANYTIGNGDAVDCTINQEDNYILVETTNIMTNLLSSPGYKLTITADISMVFSDIEAEFPEKSTSNSGIGVNVSATSNLAYDSNRLAYTSMSEPFVANPLYYYRESVSVAILSYKAVKESDDNDTNGKDSKNYSRLGINGKTSVKKEGDTQTKMEINSEALFNASAIEDIAYAGTKKIRFTLTLNKKTDTVENGVVTKAEYVKTDDISKYLKDVSIKIDNTPLTAVSQLTDNTYIYEIAVSPTENTEISETGETTSSQQSIRLSEDKIYKADIQYYAVTGDGFTEYSNYQVVLQAELLDKDGVTIGNKPTDYLVYTNAKVYPTVIEESNT